MPRRSGPRAALGWSARRARQTQTEPELPRFEDPAGDLEAALETWPPPERARFEEWMEDARSELQRELLRRVVAARHSPAEVHAFADEIRGLADGRLYALCTVPDEAADVPVTHRLRAEADPLFAMELGGHRLTPRLEDDPGPAYQPARSLPRPAFRVPPALLVPEPPPKVGRGQAVFEEESSTARGRSLAARELGASGDPLPSVRRPAASAWAAHLSEAVQALGLQYREVAADGGAVGLEKALELAARALARGVPVPVVLGRRAGERGRQALLLQVVPAGKARAFQLHDPFSGETVWANERDLLGRRELPFESKHWTRITFLALPAS